MGESDDEVDASERVGEGARTEGVGPVTAERRTAMLRGGSAGAVRERAEPEDFDDDERKFVAAGKGNFNQRSAESPPLPQREEGSCACSCWKG